MRCPPHEELLAKIAAGERVPHLDACTECAALAAAAVVAVAAFRGRRSAADRALAELVDEALEDVPPRHWSTTLVLNCALHRSAVVRELLRRADEQYENPRVVVDITTAAVGLCEAMSEAGMPPSRELFFDALKEHATALRCEGSLNAAMETLARAWTLTAEMENCEQYRAIVTLCTAITYTEPDVGKFNEAISLAETAAAVLEVCGDERRALLARQTKAHALATMQRYELALPLALSVAAELEEIGSGFDAAAAHHLVAHCCVGVGAYDDALHHANVAKRGYESIGNAIGEVRVAHEAARALAASGRFDEARPEFERAAEAVFAARSFDVWAIFRLDYVAAALHHDPAADVRIDVESLARVCLTIGGENSTMRRRYAAEALDYLRRLAKRDAVTTEAVDYIREFVTLNALRPPVRFTPPRAGEFVM